MPDLVSRTLKNFDLLTLQFISSIHPFIGTNLQVIDAVSQFRIEQKKTKKKN